ncbi:MAG TPA: DUF3662 domain-containing protein, partial [Armatimonadota bacterium]|nr:DUF3662 domain-containing protein [Armatimonadota bacterium]
MELLDRLEKALEGLIERFTDGVFRTPVQPVEIGKRLVREMDAHRTVAPSSTFVPNLFVIIVSADTFAKFSMLCPPLLTEFETLLKQHVADQGYKTVGPIAVRLQEDESLKAHEVKITPVSMKTPPPMNAVLDAELAKQGTVLDPLRAGDDLVMGNRFKGGIAPGAMPWHHKYIGNPVLSFLGRLFFKTVPSDFHCGLRGFDRDAIRALHLRTTGMEFASEMLVKATLSDLRVSEVPTTLKPDGRSRPPHLRSFRDGWRHLRFLLVFSPRWLFLYPGYACLAVGLFLGGLLWSGPINLSPTV